MTSSLYNWRRNYTELATQLAVNISACENKRKCMQTTWRMYSTFTENNNNNSSN